jgi:hypothetical protein
MALSPLRRKPPQVCQHVDITAATFASNASIWTELDTSITAIERCIANLNRRA